MIQSLFCNPLPFQTKNTVMFCLIAVDYHTVDGQPIWSTHTTTWYWRPTHEVCALSLSNRSFSGNNQFESGNKNPGLTGAIRNSKWQEITKHLSAEKYYHKHTQKLILPTHITNNAMTANIVMYWMSVSINKIGQKYRVISAVTKHTASVPHPFLIILRLSRQMFCIEAWVVYSHWNAFIKIRMGRDLLPQPQPAPWLASASCLQFDPQHPPHPHDRLSSCVTADEQARVLKPHCLASHELTSGPTSHNWSGRPRAGSAGQRGRGAAQKTGIQNIRDTLDGRTVCLTLALESGDTYIPAGEAVAVRRLYKGSRPMGAMVDRAALPRRLHQLRPVRLVM